MTSSIPSVNAHLGCLHILTVVNSAVVNIGVHGSFQITVSSGYMLWSGSAWSYDSSVFSFLRNIHAVLHSGYTSFHPHERS